MPGLYLGCQLNIIGPACQSRAVRRGDQMRKLVKTGVVVFAVGAAVYALPAVWLGYPTHIPLRAPFSTESGAVFRHQFTVRTAHTYFLDLGCHDVAPLDYSLSDFLSSGPSQPRIPCDISVQVSHQGKAIQSEHL